MLTIIHIVNQFFAGLGGERAAHVNNCTYSESVFCRAWGRREGR
ncbi:MAG: hypothetical protein HYY81_00225 [Deltaproteobacteria bacterium]|nr:hypothetical protein [Deltaproteobacteria bacterium]